MEPIRLSCHILADNVYIPTIYTFAIYFFKPGFRIRK